MVVAVVFVVPAAATVPVSLAAFAGAVVVVADACLFFVVGDVALVLAAAVQDFEVALFAFVALFVVVEVAQQPLHVPQAEAWQMLYALKQPGLISLFLCLTVAVSV